VRGSRGNAPRARNLVLTLAVSAAALLAAVPAKAAVFSNPAPIVPRGDEGPMIPYPSTIQVSGLTPPVSDVNITLNQLSSTYPSELGLVLVAPAGQALMFMRAVGSGDDVSGLTLTFDDEAATPAPVLGPLAGGTYKPAAYAEGAFTAPGPGLLHGNAAPEGIDTLASRFDGIDPNGSWRLFVEDFDSSDMGTIAGGWSLDIAAPFSNSFSVDRVKRKKKKGIVILFVTVPNPGQIGVRGNGIKPIEASGATARASRSVTPGTVKLKIKAKKKGRKGRRLRRRLNRKGKARRKLEISYTPTGGTTNTEKHRVKLIKK